MAHLTLSTFGPLDIRLGGVPVTAFDSNKVRALLVYLAIEAESPHPREFLAGLLWPDVLDHVAHTNLRNALANLRKAIHDAEAEPPHLSITHEAIQFNAASDCWIDVAAFRALTGRTNGRRAQGAPGEELSRLEQALALYHGPFLSSLPVRGSTAWEEWCGRMREQLDREAWEALERVAAGYEQRGGELERALAHARRQVAWAPWREEGHRRVMRLLAHSGQRSAALAQYEACRRALRQELEVEPEPETVHLYEQIRSQDLSGVRTSNRSVPQHNLPAALTPFVGRQQELAELGRLLAGPETRLVTVVGPGGSGKTRLALEAAAAEVDRYAHGVWFVPLASLQAAEGIVPTIAQALGFAFAEGRPPRGQLLDYLRGKQMLLLLDNCEHLLAGGDLWAEVLEAAAGVRLLATSRVRLDLQGEHVFELAGMACPPEAETAPERLAAYSAAALFLATAQRVRPGWAPRNEDGAHIVRLCRQVEGMPLALLLAAAWVDTLSPADIARRVAQDLGFLESEWRDVPARQRSMRAVCEASWRLLTEREQAVYAALSLFRGGFTAEAAQEVAEADVRVLRALVHKSFLQVERPSAQAKEARYGVHELLRQYALEKLEQTPDEGRMARDRHSAHYLGRCVQWERELKGPRQRAALGEMEVELGNLGAAWAWAVECGHWVVVEQAAEGLAMFHSWRRRLVEARVLFGQAAERLSALVAEEAAIGPEPIRVLIALLAWQSCFEPDDPLRARLAHCCQELLARPGLAGRDVRRQRALVLRVCARHLAGGKESCARALLEESLVLCRSLGDRFAEAAVLSALGSLEYNQGQVEDSAQLWEESLALSRALGDQYGIAGCLYGLHLAYGWQERFAEAEEVIEERMAIARDWGDRASLERAYFMLGGIWGVAGRFTESVEVLEQECLPRLEELGDWVMWAYGNAWVGHYKLDSGDYGVVRAHAERSLVLGRAMNSWQAICAALPVLAEQALLQGRPAEASRLYQETLAMAHEAAYHVLRIFYGGEWAVAEMRLGRCDAARVCLCTALRTAVDGRTGTMPIRVLVPAAEWLAATGQVERAVEVYALALRYPHIANSRWYQDVFGPPMAAAAASLPPDVVRAAQARGRERDLSATVRELLAELDSDCSAAKQTPPTKTWRHL